LQRHKRFVHSNRRPYQCLSCGKTFVTNEELKRHERTHAKPFVCSRCSKSFARREQLKTHLLKSDLCRS